MYLLLILFFASLLAIIVMIGRKLLSLEHEEAITEEEFLFEVPHLDTVSRLALKNMKKYGHLGLIATIRLYFRSTNILKSKLEVAKEKIKEVTEKKDPNGEKPKISKFLKTVTDYKHKIREIKHKIKEEENSS